MRQYIQLIGSTAALPKGAADIAPTLATACAALPPEGANPPWGGPAVDCVAPTGSVGVGMSGADKVFYTTGRLTSEMVIKSAQMGVPIVVSRSGITQMGQQVAERLGLCTIGRAMNRRFLCFSGVHRLLLEPGLAGERAELRVASPRRESSGAGG